MIICIRFCRYHRLHLIFTHQGKEETRDSDRLLSAVLASLCSPTVKLRATFPILTDPDAEVTHRPSPADNAALSTLQPGDLYRYPLLVEHMTYKTHVRLRVLLLLLPGRQILRCSY